MAIHPEVEGLEVTVQVNGSTAAEYQGELKTESDKERLIPHPVRCSYIESRTGENFQIHVKFSGPFLEHLRSDLKMNQMLRVTVSVDGRDLADRWNYDWVFIHARSRNSFTQLLKPAIYLDGGRFEYDFAFGDVQTEENASFAKLANDSYLAKGLGEILVKVDLCALENLVWSTWTAESIRSSARMSLTPTPTPPPSELGCMKLAEQAVKGKELSHRARRNGFTWVPRTLPRLGEDRFSYTTKFLRCICHFNFGYRSKESLQKLWIIPPPFPTLEAPEPTMQDLHRLSADQIQALALEGLRAQNEREAAERSGSSVKPKPETDTLKNLQSIPHAGAPAGVRDDSVVDLTREAKPMAFVDLTED